MINWRRIDGEGVSVDREYVSADTGAAAVDGRCCSAGGIPADGGREAHRLPAAVGFDLSPAEERPVLTLSPEALPALGDEVFRECWILSPDFRRSFRPAVGDELKPDEICSWQCLHLVWL